MKLKNFLIENSFYTTDDEKTDFINNETKLANAFWINYLGFVSLYNKDKDNILLTQYFRDKIQVNSVDDNSNDLFLIIKLLHDQGKLRNTNELTRFLALLKKKKIDKIDEDLLRTMLKKISLAKVTPAIIIKTEIAKFLEGSVTLESIDLTLYVTARKRKVCDEFVKIYKKMKNIGTDDVNDSDNKPMTEDEQVSFFNDLYGKHFYEIPFIKDNKLAVKLFIVNLFKIADGYPQSQGVTLLKSYLKEKGTSVDEIMSIISEQDAEELWNTDFPKTNKILGRTPYKNLNRINNFDNVVNSIMCIALPYQSWCEKYVSRLKLVSLSDSIGNVLNNIKTLNSDLTQIIKTYLKDSNFYSSDFRTNTMILLNYDKARNHFFDVCYQNDINYFTGIDSGLMKHMVLSNKKTYKIFKEFYENSSPIVKKDLRDKIFNFEMVDSFDFIKLTTDEIEEMYNKFVVHMKTGISMKIAFKTYKQYTDKYNFTQRFIERFEDDDFDNFLNLTSNKRTNDYLKILKSMFFVKNRKRPFNLVITKSTFSLIDNEILVHDKIDEFINNIIWPKLITTQFKTTLGWYAGWVNIFTSEQQIYFMKNYITDLDERAIRQFKNLKIEDIDKERNFFQQLDNNDVWIINNYWLKEFNYVLVDVPFIKSKFDPWSFSNTANLIFSSENIEPKIVVKEIRQYIDENFENISSRSNLLHSNEKVLQNHDYRNMIINNREYIKSTPSYLYKLFNQKNYEQILDLIFTEQEKKEQMIKNIKDITSYEGADKVAKISTLKSIDDIIDVFKVIRIQKATIPKQLKEFGIMDLIIDKMDKCTDDQFEKLITTIFEGKNLLNINNQIKKTIVAEAVVGEIFKNKTALIHPNEVPSRNRIKKVLKFNNIEVEDIKLRKKKGESLKSYYKRLQDSPELLEKIEDLKIEKIEETKEELEIKTVEYSKYDNGRHGNHALEFIESFTINLQSDEFDEFIKQNPDPVIIPAFHGTGSIAASMILRYGFAVLPEYDKSGKKNVGVVARMLGDGIYFTNVLEKAALYIGDEGYARQSGVVGYIFEMEGYIGKSKINHSTAGHGNDRIYSPEWCVFDPRAQLKFLKAHKVIMTTKQKIAELKKKHPTAITEDRYFKRFSQFLNEKGDNKVTKKNVITYIFMEPDLIDYNGKIISFEDMYKKYKSNKNVHVNTGQKGPEVMIYTDAKVHGSVHIPYTDDFKEQDPNGLYSQYISILKGALRK